MTKSTIITTIIAMLLRFDALTDDDKESIKTMCKDAGIKASFNKRCKDCFKDALLLLKQHYGVTMPDNDIVTPSGNFIYHRGNKKVVWWWRHTYYELSAQTDDATIRLYMSICPSQKHYSRVKHEPTETATEETPTEGGNGAESGENTDGGTTEQQAGENPSTGENEKNNVGVNAEGDNDGKEQTNEENS